MLSDIAAHAAKAHPDAIAFRDHVDRLTFREFADKTARLGRFLQDKGVAEGDRVAISMPATVLTAISVHGVFRSGGAFVPVDPEAPVERMRAMLMDCNVRHVLATPEMHDKIKQACDGLDIACLVGTGGADQIETSWDDIWSCSDDPTPPSEDPERLAYIMYTSGSTGTPKGIAHSHRSGLAYVRNSAEVYEVGPGEVIATSGPLHFDISTFVYLTAPAMAATAVVVPQPIARMPASMMKLIESAGVTQFYTAASALVQLIERGAPEKHDLSALKWVLFCGEPLPPAHLVKAMELIPKAWFSNSYGPAEVNECTYFNIAPGTDVASLEGQVPIGKCWAHTIGKIVNGSEEAAAGEEGELVINSPTMMLEYWNRPDLNDKAFYFDAQNRKFYRTGDIVRVNAGGEYVLVGRVDRQIKVRGFRVELDEIELHLAEHPDVQEAAAFPVLRDGATSEIGAAALVTQDADVSKSDLVKHLSAHVPQYALPTHFDLVDVLPRTSSGKIDRRLLSQKASDVKRDGE